MRDMIIDHVRTRVMESLSTLKWKYDTWEGKLYAYMIMDLMITKIEESKEELRKQLLEEIPKNGKPTDDREKHVNYICEMDGWTISRENRVGKVPEVSGLLKLLEKHGIEVGEACNEVRKWEPDSGKIEFLVRSGKLSAADVEPLHKVQSAVVVRHKDELKAWLKQSSIMG